MDFFGFIRTMPRGNMRKVCQSMSARVPLLATLFRPHSFSGSQRQIQIQIQNTKWKGKLLGHISSFSSTSQRQRQTNTYIPKLSSGHTLAPSPLLHKHKDKTHKTHKTYKAQKGKGYCAGHSGSLSLQAVVNLFVPKKCSFKAPLEIFIIDKMEHHKSCWHISKGGRANFWLYGKVASSAPCYVACTQRQRKGQEK